MKITIRTEASLEETKVEIVCRELTQEVEELLATIRMMNQQITAEKDGEMHLVNAAKIVYIEAVERKTFVYTEEDVYESKLRLYEMEERLMNSGFLRISKSCLVQLKYIKSLKNDLNRKLRLTLESGEQIMVSRQYAEEIKKRLGVI
ncbi:MAG: LytTR family transcriptional regulator DNA-binding domain-containing protein [Lachnospiraceae bacterium]|nr:LytTR family transcriptional regulator [Lachnospiraceae bacterium]MBQ8261162.1 LytTR family transcriptional regulator DNA-binding domain-containing protein [Lachnospiraceae bacterium]